MLSPLRLLAGLGLVLAGPVAAQKAPPWTVHSAPVAADSGRAQDLGAPSGDAPPPDDVQAAAPLLVASDQRPDLGGAYVDLQTGETVDLSDRDDTLLLLDVWATWCAPCVAEIPVLRALAAKHAGRVRLVSVNADAVTGGGDAAAVRAFMARHGIDYPVLYDMPEPSLAERLVARGYPAKFLVSADGSLLVAPGARYPMVNLGDVDAYLSELAGL